MTNLFAPETLYPLVKTLVFAGVTGVTLAGALVAALTSRLIYSITGLALSFVGLAGLYFYLNSPFLALMQLLIYVGAICIVIMFAMMLADLSENAKSGGKAPWAVAVSFVAAGLFAAAMVVLAAGSTWMPKAAKVNPGAVGDIGRALIGRYGFPFELISVVLLLACLGALVVARTGRRKS